MKQPARQTVLAQLESSGASNLRAFATAAVTMVSRDAEVDLVPVCRELGIGIVAYSPLGRGMLTGAFSKPEDIPEGERGLEMGLSIFGSVSLWGHYTGCLHQVWTPVLSSVSLLAGVDTGCSYSSVGGLFQLLAWHARCIHNMLH